MKRIAEDQLESDLEYRFGYLAEFIGFRIALLCYWVNIVVPGFLLYAIWQYARRRLRASRR